MQTKTSLTVVKLNSFDHLLKETSSWKNHFYFVWPLSRDHVSLFSFFWHTIARQCYGYLNFYTFFNQSQDSWPVKNQSYDIFDWIKYKRSSRWCIRVHQKAGKNLNDPGLRLMSKLKNFKIENCENQFVCLLTCFSILGFYKDHGGIVCLCPLIL